MNIGIRDILVENYRDTRYLGKLMGYGIIFKKDYEISNWY